MIKKGQHDFSNFSNSSKTINCTSKLQEKSFYYLYYPNKYFFFLFKAQCFGSSYVRVSMSLSSHLNNPTKHRKQYTTSTAGYVSFYCVNPPMKNYTWEVASLGPVSVIYCSLTKSSPYLVYRIFTQFFTFRFAT